MLIGKKYKIESDELNVTVYRRSVAIKGKNAGGETWTAEGYFHNLHNALNYLVEREVRETELKDLALILENVERVKADILEAITKAGGDE